MDAPFALPDPRLQTRLLAHVDVEEKIPRALQQLGPVADRRVLLVGGDRHGFRARQLAVLGARVSVADPLAGTASVIAHPGGGAEAPYEVAIALWPDAVGPAATTEAQVQPAPDGALRELERAVAPGGRLLLVEDYGRDDVAGLWGDPSREARLVAWSRRDGPLLAEGYRLHVLHCWWTFRDLAQAAELLAAAFPDAGPSIAAGLRRPRLSYKVAVYHRTVPPEAEAA